MGCDPEQTAELLADLAADLRKLAEGQCPTPSQLRNAPLLTSWTFAHRPSLVFSGSMFNHPVVGDGRTSLTSEIYAIDPGRRWARTLSRFYELGPVTLHGLAN